MPENLGQAHDSGREILREFKKIFVSRTPRLKTVESRRTSFVTKSLSAFVSTSNQMVLASAKG